MGEFIASTDTDRDGYETCVGPHGSGTVNQNSTKFLDFTRSHGLKVAGSWFQRPQALRWTWYSNAGGVTKEIDHVLVDGRWRRPFGWATRSRFELRDRSHAGRTIQS